MKPCVLIAIPYHPSKEYCWPLFMRSLHAIREATKTADVEFLVRFDPNEIYGAADNVKKQREFFRQQALDRGFDYLFFHGHDTIPPADVIDRLLAHGKEVVSGVYWRRQLDGGTHGIAWWRGVSVETKDRILRGEDSHITGLSEIDGFGLDCVLIGRAALSATSWDAWGVSDDDYPFCDAMTKAGIPLHIDVGVQCRHYQDSENYSFEGQPRTTKIDEKL